MLCLIARGRRSYKTCKHKIPPSITANIAKIYNNITYWMSNYPWKDIVFFSSLASLWVLFCGCICKTLRKSLNETIRYISFRIPCVQDMHSEIFLFIADRWNCLICITICRIIDTLAPLGWVRIATKILMWKWSIVKVVIYLLNVKLLMEQIISKWVWNQI